MTVYQSLFDIDILLCERFRFTPISLRKENAAEVFLLLRRLTEYNERKYVESGGQAGDEIRMIDGEQVVFRRAGDNWF